jgi:hypothetical protein
MGCDRRVHHLHGSQQLRRAGPKGPLPRGRHRRGIGTGSLVVDAVGHHTYWSIAVIPVTLFFGFYLIPINYALMVVAITVMVSQLHVQLGEYNLT